MMSKYTRNKEGYADSTAGIAIGRVSRAETQRRKDTLNAEQMMMQGVRNRNMGETFESYIIAACEYYWRNGYACIEKTPEPMVPIKPYGNRSRGQFIAYYKKKAQPDFKGALCDGSCIIFDAKYTEKDRISQSVVTDKQIETLDKYEKMGARCYILVSLKMQTFYRIPWEKWKSMKETYGRKYMTEEELKPYQVPYRQCAVQFLEGVVLNEITENRADEEAQ